MSTTKTQAVQSESAESPISKLIADLSWTTCEERLEYTLQAIVPATAAAS